MIVFARMTVDFVKLFLSSLQVSPGSISHTVCTIWYMHLLMLRKIASGIKI